MELQNRRALRGAAIQNLQAAPGTPHETALLYAGGTALLSLTVTFVLFLLDQQIAGTGGLGNLGLRSTLETVRYILPLALNIVLLCVSFGYRIAAVRMARRQESGPATLLEGFRCFGPLLRLLITETLIYLAIAFVTMYLATQIFIMTPLAKNFLEIMAPLLTSTSVISSGITLDDTTLLAATHAMLPMLPIFLILFLIAAVPIYYQYRMAPFMLVDEPRRGALAAMRDSRAMMRRNRLALFKLDLSFWWYYLAQLVIGVIGYGDLLLPLLGVSFPFSDTVGSFLFYILSLSIQVGLHALCLNRVHVTYAMAYDALRPQPKEPTKVALGNIFDM